MMRCGRSKEVRTPELIGQIKNFMEKDSHVSIETISAQFDVSVGTVHTIIREKLNMQKICAKFVPRVLREDQKERRCHDSKKMVELINSNPAVLDALVTCDESWIYCYNYLTKMGIKTVHHSPYSPDLAPCDLWLFSKLKKKLRGSRYETHEEMKEAVTKVIDTLTQEDVHGAFQKLLERYKKCIATGGDYFEED